VSVGPGSMGGLSRGGRGWLRGGTLLVAWIGCHGWMWCYSEGGLGIGWLLGGRLGVERGFVVLAQRDELLGVRHDKST